MGYFFPCFGSSNHRKSRNKRNIIPSRVQRDGTCEILQSEPIKQEIEKKIEPIADSKDKHEAPLDDNFKKKVTFDLSGKTKEPFPTQQTKDFSVKSEKEKEKENKDETKMESQSLSDSSVSSVFSYPPSHRYHNCTSSEDESQDMETLKSDHLETSESLFSLSIESRKQVFEHEFDEKEVNSPLNYGLNPVENLNLSQRKMAKAIKFTPWKDQEKENINLEQEMSIPVSEEPSFKPSKQRFNLPKPEFKETTVETSLSSWLVESETTPISRNSPNSIGNSPGRANSSRSYEDRPILGALTVMEIKLLSATASPRRKSPRRSPDEIPIIGTVGRYWTQTGLDSNSDSGVIL
ncbi:uncharacterized protein LOC130759597 [Actinidia eriantha]|uniref:uncharacterized protein LOC130759597 n=1 Tax=Actinidia eriantha TaxID=165200 RepID=UPI00258A4FA3|nr:uncharacterized protein LOC130759597 [Actinidia eriantha]